MSRDGVEFLNFASRQRFGYQRIDRESFTEMQGRRCGCQQMPSMFTYIRVSSIPSCRSCGVRWNDAFWNGGRLVKSDRRVRGYSASVGHSETTEGGYCWSLSNTPSAACQTLTHRIR